MRPRQIARPAAASEAPWRAPTELILAPCGHPGERVVGDYVHCPRCDAMPDRDEFDPRRYIMCPSCKTLDVIQLANRNNRPWWRCMQCKLEFEPTKGNQP